MDTLIDGHTPTQTDIHYRYLDKISTYPSVITSLYTNPKSLHVSLLNGRTDTRTHRVMYSVYITDIQIKSLALPLRPLLYELKLNPYKHSVRPSLLKVDYNY